MGEDVRMGEHISIIFTRYTPQQNAPTNLSEQHCVCFVLYCFVCSHSRGCSLHIWVLVVCECVCIIVISCMNNCVDDCVQIIRG